MHDIVYIILPRDVFIVFSYTSRLHPSLFAKRCHWSNTIRVEHTRMISQKVTLYCDYYINYFAKGFYFRVVVIFPLHCILASLFAKHDLSEMLSNICEARTSQSGDSKVRYN